jgi:hypothetical protein
VLTKDYETARIRIAFHPLEEKFEVANPAIQKDPAWMADVADLFSPNAKLLQITKAYASANAGVDDDKLFGTLERLRKIINNCVGVIELSEDLDIEMVTEIFIRVNSAGATLSQADFAMSKIAANTTLVGSLLRKAVDYFCHLVVAPDFASIRRPIRTCCEQHSPPSSSVAGFRTSSHCCQAATLRPSSLRRR